VGFAGEGFILRILGAFKRVCGLATG